MVSDFESLDSFYKTAESGSNPMNDNEVHKYLSLQSIPLHKVYVILLIRTTTLGT
jgi:hypothetical protein